MVIITNAETFRKNICDKFTNIIGNNITAINLEKGVFNYSLKEATSRKLIKKWENPDFVQVYLDRLRTIYINLKNTEILTLLQNKELLPQSFASMTHQEMNPKRWHELLEQKMKRDANKFTTNIQA